MIGHKTFRLKLLTAELLATTFIGLSLLGSAGAEPSPAGAPPNDEVQSLKAEPDLPNLLPLLLTSPDRRQLLENLEASIRSGDLKKAEQSLTAAMEIGTLAIVLVNHLNDPMLLKTLQDLGIRGGTDASALKDIGTSELSNACAAPATPPPADLAALQEALEQERSHSRTVSQTLAALTQEHNALVAQQEADKTSQSLKTTELEQALRQEQEQSRSLGEELAQLREQYRALQAAREQDSAAVPARISELEALLQQERERSDEAMGQLASVQKELRDLQAAHDAAAASDAARVLDLEEALARAQMRNEALMQEIADAADELTALRATRQTGPTPLMIRLAAMGTVPSLAERSAPSPEPPVPLEAGMESSAVGSTPSPQDIPPEAPKKEPATVVIAALPGGIQPLPIIPPEPPKAEPPAPVEPRAEPPVPSPKVDDRIVIRAEELFRKGDVSGARLLLEHALAGGNARAAFLLAETFDPNVLSELGVLGIRGDAAKAREFYAQAHSLGMAEAGKRMEALKSIMP